MTTPPFSRFGRSLLAGNGAPTNDLGQPGDIYLDLDTGDYFGPKSAGVWGSAILASGLQAKLAAAVEARDAAESAKADAEEARDQVVGEAATKADKATSITVSGLLSRSAGDGTLGGNQTLTVTEASEAETLAGLEAGKVITPRRLKASLFNNVHRLDARVFGVRADGVTDDTEALQTAFDWSAENRCPIGLPGGRIVVSDTLILDDYMDIAGQPGQTIIRLADGANCSLIETRDYAAFVADSDSGVFPQLWRLSDVVLDQNGNVPGIYAGSNTSGYCLAIAAASYWLDNVLALRGAEGGIITKGERNYLVNTVDEPSGRVEALSIPRIGKISAARCGGYGIRYEGVDDAFIQHVEALICADGGLYIGPGVVVDIDTVHNYSNHGPGVYLDDCTARIKACQSESNYYEDFVMNGTCARSYIGVGEFWGGNRIIETNPSAAVPYPVVLNGVGGGASFGELFVRSFRGSKALQIKPGSGGFTIQDMNVIRADGTAAELGVEIDGQGLYGCDVKGRISGYDCQVRLDDLLMSQIDLTLGSLSATAGASYVDYQSSSPNYQGNTFRLRVAGGASGTFFKAGSSTPNNRDKWDVDGQGGSYPQRYRSHNRRVSADVSVTTTGVKTAMITHGLIAAPDINNITVSFAKPTINYDNTARFSNLVVTAVDATTITCEFAVTTAGGTGARIAVLADAKIGGMYTG
ncbi:glycoside hydrolase family 55 protein [Phenylobacterium sp. J426]|uniref:glycoside hydrolase family 55 protein n=1 Tax=Phenylobacterium sp. J426 TaxID=2898439 RepID=UPI0021515AC1|nr:glycoside hydrolase family 55 protein [Phenylobacterium sp. J426]MCR5875179.1 glycoside hydrolase family 55 protein [Phenylobacterium sp. J426]